MRFVVDKKTFLHLCVVLIRITEFVESARFRSVMVDLVQNVDYVAVFRLRRDEISSNRDYNHRHYEDEVGIGAD